MEMDFYKRARQAPPYLDFAIIMQNLIYMMQKFRFSQKTLLILISLFCHSLTNFAQVSDTVAKNKMVAMAEKEEIEDTTEEDKSSYFTAELGLGNRIINVRNNGIISKISPSKTLIWTPTVVYHHKSGLYLSAGLILQDDKNRGFSASQYLLSPGYELPENNNILLSFAYTHYFVVDHFSAYASPIQNDWYASVTYKKLFIRPAISLGYSSGTYGEVKRIANKYDSITNNITAFSIVPSASHEFKCMQLFSKIDALSFTPSLMLNVSNGTTAFHHNTNLNILNFLSLRDKLPKFENTTFQFQSMGLNLDASYEIGKLTIEPQFYFDYYLSATTDKRLTGFGSLDFKYSF